NQKLEFQKLHLNSIINNATRFHFKDVTDEQIKVAVINWFRNSKDLAGGESAVDKMSLPTSDRTRRRLVRTQVNQLLLTIQKPTRENVIQTSEPHQNINQVSLDAATEDPIQDPEHSLNSSDDSYLSSSSSNSSRNNCKDINVDVHALERDVAL
ncbi:unnamed protein product, partial [Allacma fusca]